MANIIVLDDDKTNTDLIKLLLELDGFQVIPSLTIEQAVTASSTDTDAFVIDCNLSRGTSGLDLLQQIRNDETGAASDTVVIMTSGDIRMEKQATELGADLFLLKPYPPEDLASTINNLLNEKEHNG
jgi:DNA-binding response OmpR family regulator